jgi:hypothetical protein
MGNGIKTSAGGRLGWVSLIAMASLVAASCGSGPGGGPSPSDPSFDLATGIANLSASKVNATMSISGTANGFNMTGSAQLTQSVASASTFNGGSALMQTTTVSGTGITAEIGNVSLLYSFVQYDSSANATLGLDTDFNSTLQYAVADSPIQFPSSVSVGDAAMLGTMTLYLNGERTDDAIQVSYKVVGDPENTDSVTVEVIDRYIGSSNGGQIYQFDYILTAAGNMSLRSLSITSPTDTATVDMFQFTVQ